MKALLIGGEYNCTVMEVDAFPDSIVKPSYLPKSILGIGEVRYILHGFFKHPEYAIFVCESEDIESSLQSFYREIEENQ